MNPNEMIYFNALVLQRDFQDEARRARQTGRASAAPAAPHSARPKAKAQRHSFLGLALPGRR